MAWNVSGQTVEACSCNVVCPCWFGVKELMIMDQGWCDTTLLFRVRGGDADGVNLAGRIVVVGADFPGPTILDGNATARLYIDDGASADQQRELEGIFSGAKGGPMEILAGLITTLLSTQTVRIDVQEDGGNLSISVGNLGVIKSHPLNDEAGRPTVIQNAMFFQQMQLSDPQVAPSGHRWSDPDLPRAFETKSGGLATFNWSG